MVKSDSASAKDSDEEEDRWIRHQLSEGNPSPVQFKRLKPRLGPQFQTKVPKHTDESFSPSRPLPDLMSAEEPFLTVQEAKKGEKRPLEALANASAIDLCSGQGYGPCRSYDRPPTKRGGLCIHRRSPSDSTSTDDFLLFCQRLTRPPQSDEGVFVTGESWKQEMIRQYGTSQPKRRSGGGHESAKRGRKGVKRKLPERDDEVWGENVGVSTDEDVPGPSLPTTVQSSHSRQNASLHEDDPKVLEYLHMRHNGDTTAAQLSVLVDFSSGRATKARRCLRKHLHNERFKRPPVASSLSWRTRFERTWPTMLGDLRADPAQPGPYPYGSSDAVPAGESKTTPSPGSDAPSASISMVSESAEDMKGVWRSVLSYGQTLEGSMCEDYKGSNRSYMSEVLSFVQNAYALPTPEASFGTRHIVVEQISLCLHSILDHISKARDSQAKLIDKLYDEKEEGVDIDSLKKFLEEADRTLPVKLDESILLGQQLEVASQWQARLDAIVVTSENGQYPKLKDCGQRMENLCAAEELVLEGKKHAFRSQNLVLLEKKIERAYRLRDRIVEWNQSKREGKKGSIKFVASMVREANRMDLTFPEASDLLRFHRSVEEWIDRANIAIRSRISLSEIESLIEKGNVMPVDLTEYLEKLRSRVRLAHDWIHGLQNEVPCPYLCASDAGEKKVDNLSWLARMREGLRDVDDGTCAVLLEMASEGSRIPVEIDCVKMLQLEIDAKNWSLKGKKWIPRGTNNGGRTTPKKGKLDDLREHHEKAEALRERLNLPPEEKVKWTMEGEAELESILEASDEWFDAYQKYLEGDNRRNQARCCIAMSKLRQIVQEANLIHANFGNVGSKMNRILSQAETWYKEHQDLLVRCGICDPGECVAPSSVVERNSLVSLSEMSAAVEKASSSISLDLEEALELGRLAKRVEKWFDRALLAAPKRSKRNVRGKAKKSRFTLDDVIALINEAHSLPVDTTEDLERLKIQLNLVQTWRLHAHNELGEIATSFCQLRDIVNSTYGCPEEFLVTKSGGTDGTDMPAQGLDGMSTSALEVVGVSVEESPESVGDGASSTEDMSPSDSGSCVSSEQDVGKQRRLHGGKNMNVNKLIGSLLKNARSTGIYTAEENVAEVLQKASNWFVRSLKYVDSPKDLYEKKYYAVFDKFLQAGEDLLVISRDGHNGSDCKLDDGELIRNLNSSWGGLLSDQLARLYTVQSHRDQFIAWSDKAEEILCLTEKRIQMETLKQLSEQSSSYPSTTDMVQKIRSLYQNATTWSKSTNELLYAENKLSMQQAKDLFEEGDKLNVACEELKTLRNALRAARRWANRVKRSKLDKGGTHVNEVKELIEEHDSFVISMPESVDKLRQAMRGYCICRRPYDGFMIGCDDCDEWYHGPCIGVSESQAGRFDKFICVRCSVTKVFKSSAATVLSLVRKWINPKDLKKARQIDWQKHQRKVRKEKRDIEKLEPEIESLTLTLEGFRAKNTQNNSQSPFAQSHNCSTVASGSSEDAIQKHALHAFIDKKNMSSISNGSGDNPSCNQDGEVDDATPTGGVSRDEGMQTKVASNSEKETQDIPSEEASIQSRLGKAQAAMAHCQDRLEMLLQRGLTRKSQEKEEDEKSECLRKWCARVCSSVLIPRNSLESQTSLPSLDGSMSASMLSAIQYSEALGVSQLPDVVSVVNSFQCISWSFRAMSVLARRPTVTGIKALVLQSSSLELPEEKSVRMMKSMVQRANLWQLKVSRALAPIPGESKPCCVETLKDLVSGAGSIPMVLPEEERLMCAIDDNGARHCICGGPNDGNFMLNCDKCERWFHGRCVNVCNGDTLHNWVCPPCNGVAPAQNLAFPVQSKQDYDSSSEASGYESDDDVSPHAPNPSKLWPPYGLLSSEESLEALGKECLDFIQGACGNDASCTGTATSTEVNSGTRIMSDRTNPLPSAVQREGATCNVIEGSSPLVVSPELPATVVDIPMQPPIVKALENVTSPNDDHLNGRVSADLAGIRNLNGCDANAKSEGLQMTQLEKDGGESVECGQPCLHGTGRDPGSEFLLKAVTEPGIVTETSVGSVEDSDNTIQNVCERSNVSSSKSPIHDVAMDAPPIAAKVVCNASLPGAYLGTVIHRQNAANEVVDQPESPVSDHMLVAEGVDPSIGGQAPINAGFVSAMGSGVPVDYVQENVP